MRRFRLFTFLIFLGTACNLPKKPALFTLLTSGQTGIDFQNNLTESDTINALNFSNIYHGAGVGIGDFNNDGLADIFFAGNMVSSKLYLNKGAMQFSDITLASGTSTNCWINGVAVIDINQDGWQDIYLCVANKGDSATAGNLLYVNEGTDKNNIPHFIERAQEFGLDDKSYSMQAAFFDYDRDGDLDMYLLNNGLVKDQDNYKIRPKKTHAESVTTDRFYENDGTADHPHFINVSARAGIQTEGYGLGVVVSDINKDGWPDIYVSNDYIASDFLWMNNGNKTFTDKNNQCFQHTSLNGMGVDAGDFNNDGWTDIIQMDMLPPDNYRKKMMLTKANYNSFQIKLSLGYQAQFLKNTLQLNNGIGPDSLPFFSEISQAAGVSSTDWSWAPLLVDFDNDGWKDLFVSNGFRRDITDLDFITYDFNNNNRFGTREHKLGSYETQLKKLPEIKISNYLFSNNHNLRFSDSTDEWGLKLPSFSTGAAYADFDNDGDEDLVVSTIDAPVLIYKNNLSERDKREDHHALKIKLKGPQGNRDGIGTTLRAVIKDKCIFYEHFLSRGYLSSMDNNILLGTGKTTVIDSLIITWPDNKKQVLLQVSLSKPITINYTDSKNIIDPGQPDNNHNRLFADITSFSGINYEHHENPWIDFNYNALIPYLASQNGPCLAQGDINGDGLEDIYIGGSNDSTRWFYIQQPNGTFIPRIFQIQGKYEDIDAILFDADNDKDLDLFVVSGSTEYPAGSASYQDRLYINDGRGSFKESTNSIPTEHSNGACVAMADYDNDGDPDLFVGGKTIPGKYPFADYSFILRNDNGVFVNATITDAPDLLSGGIANAAVWADINNDGYADLITAGEFSAVELYINNKGKLQREEKDGDLSMTGWWTALAAADIDKDGDIDLVAGNMGYNTHYKASRSAPMSIYGLDYDHNGTIDPILGIYSSDVTGRQILFPEQPLDQLAEQIPMIKKFYHRYKTFATASMDDLVALTEQKNIYIRHINALASMYFENTGNATFKASPLPGSAQVSPVYKILITDINADSIPDIITGGNNYAWDSRNGYMDASFGGIFIGNGKGQFIDEPFSKTGFYVKGALRSMVMINTAAAGRLLVAGVNHKPIKVFKNIAD